MRFTFPAGFAARSKAAEAKSWGTGGREGPVREETTRHQGTVSVVARSQASYSMISMTANVTFSVTFAAIQKHLSSFEQMHQTILHTEI